MSQTAHALRGHAGRRPRPVRTAVVYVLVTALGLTIIVPVVYGVLGGFKDTAQLSTNGLGLPHPWVVSNYTDIVTSKLFWRQVGNSVLIAAGTALITVATGACAAFVFARFAFRGREFLAMLFAIGLMFPPAVAILPVFVLLRSFGLLDNPLGVILPQAAFFLPVTIIILRSFFRQIPREVEEAATMDGCSTFRFFWSILLPMARPAIATVSVLAIVTSWNNFFLPLVVFNNPDWWTIPVGLQQFKTEYSTDYARVLAYTVMAMVPALAFYAVAERQLIGGFTTGAVKG
jgi:raffinose/stachyose/melibiose transport system permease protein